MLELKISKSDYRMFFSVTGRGFLGDVDWYAWGYRWLVRQVFSRYDNYAYVSVEGGQQNPK